MVLREKTLVKRRIRSNETPEEEIRSVLVLVSLAVLVAELRKRGYHVCTCRIIA